MSCDHKHTEYVDTLQCQSCEAFSEDDDGPLYECSSCGTVFTRGGSANENHQCPQCNKFGAKRADRGCPVCEAGELEDANAWFCHDCETYLEEEPA